MNKILEIKFGSHLYGTDTPNSDLDLKGIYLPTAREIVLHTYKKTISTTRPKRDYERNNKDDVDIEIFSLDRYVELLTQGQTVALDMLFAPREMFTQQPINGILAYIFYHREKFLSKSMCNAFFGYAKQQAAKYGQKGFRVAALRETLDWISKFPEHYKLYECNPICFTDELLNEHVKIVECRGPNGTMANHLGVCSKKYPFHADIKYVKAQLQRRFDEYGHRALLAEKNEGVDWKALSHAVRVNSQAKELLTTHKITFPRPDKDLLLKIKLGQMDYKEVAEIIEKGLAEMVELEKTSTLPDEPDMEFVNNFVFNIYLDVIKGLSKKDAKQIQEILSKEPTEDDYL